MAERKPGRNEPCWCGSGKKYKKCHLASDLESAERDAESAPRARDIFELRESVLAPRQVRSDEIGPPRR